jgi:pyruvate dehydrogenase E1 component
MFQANGGTVLDAKYGRRLEGVFERRGGEALRQRLDEMPNEEYQALIRQRGPAMRSALLDGASSATAELSRLFRGIDDEELATCLTDLAGHDVGALASCYSEASAAAGPAVIFAYTFKGHGLPFMSDPMNHSALLTDEQFTELGRQLGEDPAHPWSRFPDDSPEGRYVAAAAERLRAKPREIEPPLEVHDVQVVIPPSSSTQDAFGRVLVELDRSNPRLTAKIVTVSPDVAMTTSLGGWINRASVWSQRERPQFADTSERVVQWREGPVGRHIELGISESNLFLLLSQLGLAEEQSGHRLVPIGTVYDCFVPRGLEPMMYAAYQGARSIVAATPAGVTLSPEGGAHQSILTPSLGIEIPGVVYYEPCFGQEVAWILVHAIGEVAAGRPNSFYLRLSTKPVDNRLFPADRHPAALRQEVLSGCYRLRRADPNEGEIVNIFAAGIMATEALAAGEPLAEEGISANIFCVTSPGLLFQRSRESSLSELEQARHGDITCGLVDEDELGHPLVTVIDGHPHTLSFLAGALSSATSTHLGVSTFGRSGGRDDLYRAFQIDTASIVSAAIGVADRVRLLPPRHPGPAPVPGALVTRTLALGPGRHRQDPARPRP